jgi:signal transduction histidine kinase
MEKYDQALGYNLKGLALNEELGNRDGIIACVVTIGGVYYVMHNYPKAETYFKKGLRVAREMNSEQSILLCLTNLGEVYCAQKRFRESEDCYRTALTIGTAINATDDISAANKGLGIIYQQTGRAKESIPFLLKSFAFANRAHDRLLMMETAKDLAASYAAVNDYKQAYTYGLQAEILKDSLNKEKADLRIQQAEFGYELEKKQHQIALLEKDQSIQKSENGRQQILLAGLCVGILLLLLMIFNLYRSRQKEQASKRLILEQHAEIQDQAKSMEQLHILKDKIFSILSHDLRSPVASLISMVQLMDMDMITSEEFPVLKTDMNRQLDALSLLLDNLLQWSKSQMRGELVIKKDLLRLNDIVQQNFNLLQDVAAQKHIRFIHTISENMLAAGDTDLVDIVVRNLISNAIKFTPQGGEIRVSCEEQNGQLSVCISDTGVGMSEDVIRKLFTNESSFSTAGTEGEKGTGLGLLLCKDFVAKNGGTIHATSEPGKGSTFCFTLHAYHA